MDLVREVRSVQGMVENARAYVQKDVATVLDDAHAACLDVWQFEALRDYFSAESMD